MEKSEENKRVAKKCKDIGAYNAGASRAYYAAFQRAKHYLNEKRFDYDSFLSSISESDERKYSHGTIKRAVVTCMMNDGVANKIIFKLVIWDNLYRNRRIADYDNRMIDETTIDCSLSDLETVLEVLTN